MHIDGAWHLHALLADTGSMIFENSGKRKYGQQIYNLSNWKWGFSTATKVRDTYRLQNYISKYITKETLIHTKNAHRYYVSNNLLEPKTSCFLLEPTEEDDFLQDLIDNLEANITHKKIISNTFVNVEYIELVKS